MAVQVTTAQELANALAYAEANPTSDRVIELAASSGTTVTLADVSMSNYDFAGAPITIRAASGIDAVFDILTVGGSSGITFENVTFKRTTGTDNTQDAARFNSCSYITIDNCRVTSTADDNPANNFQGIYFNLGSNITVIDTEFFQLDLGLNIRGASDVVVSGNLFHHLDGDGMAFNSVSNAQIIGNTGRDFVLTPPDHQDFIQYYTNPNDTLPASENVEIRGNVLLAPDANIQGIFVTSDDARGFHNFEITENLIVTAASHGISLKPGFDSAITNNTVIGVGDNSHGVIRVYHSATSGVSDNVVVQDNITTAISIDQASTRITNTGNLDDLQVTDPKGANYVGDLFVDALAADPEVNDFLPIPGAGVPSGVGVTAMFTTPTGYIAAEYSLEPDEALHVELSAVDWDATIPPGTTYTWDFGFGDDVTGEGANVTHRFSEPGLHTVTLTINTPGVGVETVDRTIFVGSPVLLDLRFDNDPAASDTQSSAVADASMFDRDASWNSGSPPAKDPAADQYILGAGGSGSAAEFQATDVAIIVGDSSDFEDRNELTVALNANPDSLTASKLVWKQGTFGLEMNGSGLLTATVWTENGPQTAATTGFSLAQDTWYSIVVTFDGLAGGSTGSLKIYVDGVQRASATVGTVLENTSNSVRIGAGNGGTGYFDGAVDNVRILGGAYDPTEIAALDAYLANPAPTDIALGGDGVYERATAGTVVGALSTTDGGDTATYALAPGSSAHFAISGSNLVVASGASLDYETATNHQVIVRATDSAGNVRQETITVAVKDAIEFHPTNGGTLSSTSGSDMVYGGSGTDVFMAGAGADTFDGGADGDTASYADLTTGVGVDLVTPSAGSGDGLGDVFIDVFQIAGTNFNDTLRGDSGVNRLSGDSGQDVLDGRGGGDLLFGGGGHDTMDGGAGADSLQGSSGNDLFVFHLGEANGDEITGFTGNGASAGDSLQFVGYGAGATLSNAGDQWTITYTGGSETFEITGVTSLDPSDYVFV